MAAVGCDLGDGVDVPESGLITQEVVGPAPDYVLTFLGSPPAAAVNGQAFTVTTTVENIGDAAAAATSTTRYFLSTDRVIGDDRSVVENATVPPLGVGEENTQDVTLSIRDGIPNGSYFLLACADRGNTIVELDNHNNCRASDTAIALTGPDLRVEAVSEPPESFEPGQQFTITVTVRNAGTAPAESSTAAFYLSSVPERNPAARRLSANQVNSGPLGPGQAVSYSVVAPTPDVPFGSYFFVACADIQARIAESDEENNCGASPDPTTSGPADLVIASVADFPASVAAGASFFAQDLTSNTGARRAPSSTNRFWLSTDEFPGDDIPLAGERLVSPIEVGASDAGWTELELAPATAPGDYFLIACADADQVVTEVAEDNNCQVSTAQLTVPVPDENTCGDRQVTPPEQCDDGNAIDDDGCDHDCVRTAVVQLAAGLDHSCARMRSGGVRCWGSSAFGQLGYGNTQTIGDNELPRTAGSVNVGGRVVELVAGYWHTCARLDSGAVRCWGYAGHGQLGYGNFQNIGDDETPASAGSVPVGAPVLGITAGAHHTCARLVNGAVRCWGNGNGGRLGYGNERPVGTFNTPAEVGDVDVGAPVVDIAAGHSHTCARLMTGAVRCWGRGREGQLGYGNRSNVGNRLTPSSAGDVNVGGMVTQLALGFHHTCARLTTGAVRCWGDRAFGELGYGNGEFIGDNEPPAAAGDVDVGGPVAEVIAGDNHTCARLTTGRVRCWGRPTFGALGYGNLREIGNNETPASAGDLMLEGVRAIDLAAGARHNCALFSAGRVRCWGEGANGKLGYGNTETIGDNEVPASAGAVRIF